ncbi:MAG: hypothetical protein ACO3A4_03880 [Silvanigrellaceae bacterium]
MSRPLTSMKLISMTCEQSVAQRALKLLEKIGVKSIRTHSIRLEEFGQESSVDLHESQIKLEFLVFEEMVETIVSQLSDQFLNRFDVGFYVTEAQVLRPEIFCNPK